MDGTAAVGAGAQPQPTLQLELVSLWQPRHLITVAITVTVILTTMATAIRHTAMPTPIDALTTVPIPTDARTTAMRIHIDARIMDIRTGGMSCTGVTDTKSGVPDLLTKNKAPGIPGL